MSRPTTRLLLPLLLLGCAHSDPFPSGDPGDNGPFNGPPPQLLTLHLGQDRTPAWSPDGSRLLYSFNQVELPDQDACLGALPPAGGTRSLEHCRLGDTFHELVEVREWPALSPTGQLAWVEQENLVGVRVPTAGAIRVGTLSPLNPGIVVRSLPYTPPGGALHLTATHLAWLGTDSLVYVGADFLVVERRSDKRPVLSDLRESAVSQATRLLLLITRKEYPSANWRGGQISIFGH